VFLNQSSKVLRDSKIFGSEKFSQEKKKCLKKSLENAKKKTTKKRSIQKIFLFKDERRFQTNVLMKK